MSDIASRVKKIIVDKLGVDEAEVTNEASFTNDLGADSLDTVELVMALEEEFETEIFFQDPLQFFTQCSVHSGYDPVEEFNHGYLAPQAAVYAAKLQSYHATAYNHQVFRHLT